MAGNGLSVLGTPVNFNGFRVLPSLLQWCCSSEANETLHDVWPSAALAHYIYLKEFCRCKVHFMSKSCALLYWQRYCTALQQWVSAKLCGVVQGMELWNLRREHHLYSAGRPSRWKSAHILVPLCFNCVCGVLTVMIKVLSYHISQYIKSVYLPDWVVDEGVELVSPVAVVRKPFQMDHKYLRQFPQVEFLGGLLVLLTCWTIPATIRCGSLKLSDKKASWHFKGHFPVEPG